MAEINNMKVEMKAGGNPNIIEIDGQKYIFDKVTTYKKDKIEHGDKVVFKRFDEKAYEADFKTVVDCLAKKTTAKELLSEIVKDFDPRVLKRYAKRIKSKKPIKKHKGCLGFKIGDSYIPLFD